MGSDRNRPLRADVERPWRPFRCAWLYSPNFGADLEDRSVLRYAHRLITSPVNTQWHRRKHGFFRLICCIGLTNHYESRLLGYDHPMSRRVAPSWCVLPARAQCTASGNQCCYRVRLVRHVRATQTRSEAPLCRVPSLVAICRAARGLVRPISGRFLAAERIRSVHPEHQINGPRNFVMSTTSCQPEWAPYSASQPW